MVGRAERRGASAQMNQTDGQGRESHGGEFGFDCRSVSGMVKDEKMTCTYVHIVGV